MRFLLLFTLVLLLPISPTQATSVLQMNLADMTSRSDKIFRGTLVDIDKTKVAIGGGQVSALTYTFKVTEVFKGTVETIKDESVVEIKMIGTMEKQQSGRRALPGFPLFTMGEQYLLMVAPSGQTGLTTTMGLGQGAFRIFAEDKTEVAVNEFNNAGLFAETQQARARAAAPTRVNGDSRQGAIPYAELAAQIHALLGK